MRARTFLGIGLFMLLPLPGLSVQTFDLTYESFEDRNGNGFINCLEPVTFRVALGGTAAPVGGDRGRIIVPFGNPDFWTYIPGSFHPVQVDGCTFSLVSGNGITDPSLILDYTCDPRAGNPLDDSYGLSFEVTGRFFSNTAGGLGVAARNERTSPTPEIQDDFATSEDPGQPCPVPPDLRLTKSLISGSGSPGATLVYSLTVNNFGASAAEDVVLQENVPAHTTFSPASSSPGWTCLPNPSAGASCTLGVGTVAAGASVTRIFAAVVNASLPPNPGDIGNTACVSTSSSGDAPEDNCGSTSTPGGNPDLRMTKSLASGSGAPGATLTYNLTVTNAGTRDASGVTIEEAVPNHTTFSVAGSSSGWACSPNGNAGATCTLPLGTVAAGATLTRTFAVVVDPTLPADPGNIGNTACVSTLTAGDPAGDNCGSTSTPPGGHPDLRTVKSLVSGSGEPGATLVYDLRVSNTGNRGAAGVQLSETVPALATFLPASSSPGWSCSPNSGAGSTCVLALGTLAAGAAASGTFAVQLAATFPADPPSIDNTACSSTSTSGDPAGDNCGSVSIPPGGNPDLRMSKSVASGSGDPGATLVYSLEVANRGNRDAAEVEIEETVPPLTSFLLAGSSPGWACTPDGTAGSSCTLAIGTVPAGTSATYTFAVRVADTFSSNPPLIDNTACVSSPGTGDPTGNDCGTTTTPPGGNPDVQLMKSIASGSGNPGSVLVYQLKVSNAGTRDADGVTLEETVPQLTSFLAASSSPGWTCTPDGNAGSSCTLLVGTVAAGSSEAYTFAVQVASSFPPNPPPIDNTACVSTTSSGDPEGNDCGSTSTPPGGQPDLALTKSLTSGTVVPDGVLVFTLTLGNQGSREAAGVALEETVLAHSTFEAVSSSPGWKCLPDGSAGSTCSLVVGTVAAGASSSHVFAVRLRPDLAPGTSVSNTACVDQAPEANGSEGDNCATVIVDPPGPQVRTDVEVALGVDGPRPPGAPFVFTLNLQNSSSVAAEGLRVMVSLPSFGTKPTELDPACQYRQEAVIECTLPELAAGDSVSFTWKHAALQLGDYTVAAELMAATPEDLDSTPANGVKIEDDYAEIVVSVVSGAPGAHDIPTLSTFGILAMVVLLVGLGVLFLKRGAAKRAHSA